MSVWSESVHAWQTVAGEFGVLVGASSRDIRLSGRLRVPPPVLVESV